METALTKKQALSEGFEHAGRKTGEYQRYVDINDLSYDEIQTGTWYLASKERKTPSIDADSLKDLISNHIDGQWYDETRDDDSTIYDCLKDVDMDEWANKINEALVFVWCSSLTDIKLIVD